MTTREALKEAYGGAGRFMPVLPWLAALPLAAEALQHMVEWRTDRAGLALQPAGTPAVAGT